MGSPKSINLDSFYYTYLIVPNTLEATKTFWSFSKIDVPNLVTHLSRAPLYKWNVIGCGSKNKKTPKKHVLLNIGVRAQNTITILGLVVKDSDTLKLLPRFARDVFLPLIGPKEIKSGRTWGVPRHVGEWMKLRWKLQRASTILGRLPTFPYGIGWF
jgi:hypothetical protein